MEWLDSLNLPPQLAGIATLVFVAAGAIFAAWSRLQGKKDGPPHPKVQEFYAAGGLADMGPVKELVQQQGLLVQQQIKANVLHGETNVLLGELATALRGHIDAQRKAEAERDLEEEIDRRARIAAEDIVRRREEEAAERRTPRKTT